MHWNTATRATTAVLLGILALPGCLTVDDDEGPIMAIDLYWDARPETESFFGGTCFEAGVHWMEWTLYRADTDEEVAMRSEPCRDGIDVIDPRPGEYRLEIAGLDEDDQIVWEATCPRDRDSSFTVLRFDVAYACDIIAP